MNATLRGFLPLLLIPALLFFAPASAQATGVTAVFDGLYSGPDHVTAVATCPGQAPVSKTGGSTSRIVVYRGKVGASTISFTSSNHRTEAVTYPVNVGG